MTIPVDMRRNMDAHKSAGGETNENDADKEDI